MYHKLYDMLNQELAFSKRILQKADREVNRLPKGKLEIGLVQKKYTQYHAVVEKDGRKERIYIPKKDSKYAFRLAQRAYDIRMRNAAEKRCKTLAQAAKALRKFDLQKVFEQESKIRQSLITPLIPTDEQFIEQWYEEHPAGDNPFPKTTTYTTLRGEEVRSKSEKMIADTYYTEGIPYVYEPVIVLDDGRTFYPDFAVLNVCERKTWYHEHFGMMDSEEYRARAILKMREYNAHGFWPGNNMVFTFEGELIPFDQNELGRIIKEYFIE